MKDGDNNILSMIEGKDDENRSAEKMKMVVIRAQNEILTHMIETNDLVQRHKLCCAIIALCEASHYPGKCKIDFEAPF